jgi:hypothetical protein
MALLFDGLFALLRPAAFGVVVLGSGMAALPVTLLAQETGGAQERGGAEAVPAEVVTEVATLVETMQIGQIIEVLREEGLAYGQTLEDDMFPGAGGPGWLATVGMIYDGGRMQEAFVASLERELAANPAGITQMEGFFASDLGQRVLTLELEARRALFDEATEEGAKAAWDELRTAGGPRLDLLERFSSTNDLIESNVMGALNSNLAFYKGMTEGGAFGGEMTEDQMLADVWGQEADIRTQTADWLFPYLTLAYGPLSDEDLTAYIAFSASPAGQQLNAALFAAFDDVFTPISKALGLAVAKQMQGQDI